MRRAAPLVCLWLVTPSAGCESCGFSLGPIWVTVRVTNADRAFAITVCPEDGPCRSAVAPGPEDTGVVGGYGGYGVFGEAVVEVPWDGYLTCRVPAMEILIEAEGCLPRVLHTERMRHDEVDTTFELALDCV